MTRPFDQSRETDTEITIEKDFIVQVEEESVLGQPLIRKDAVIKATGQAKYIDDISRPGMLYGKILFSDRSHAKIVKIDVSKALALPGVEAVITSKDAPNKLYGLYIFDRLIFAKDSVRHVGEPVAALAAKNIKIAEKAVKLIEVEYEELPAILDIKAALEPNAPILHPDVESYSGIHPYIKYGNVCMDAKINSGDVDKGFAEADHVIENKYRLMPMHQAAIEPHGCLAELDPFGKLTVWTSTQQISICHSEMARALDMPMDEIRIIAPMLGGGFGGKLKTMFEPICGLLTKVTKKPVKLILSREEVFKNTHPRSEYRIYMKTGFMNDGTLVAREADVFNDVGPYSDHAVGTMTHALTYAQGPYHIPNVRARGRSVYTNNPDWGCMRGYGALQIAFAFESQMDEAAAVIGIDPVEFRLMNLIEEGEPYITGQKMRNVTIRETMEAAIDASGYRAKKGKMGSNRGIGIANSILNSGFLSSSAFSRLNEDGTLSLMTAIVDLGTGTHTVFRQIAAETMSIPVEKVSVSAQDTDSSPYDTGSIASRTTMDGGNAVRLACEDVRKQLIEVAATSMKCMSEDIVLQQGIAYNRNNPSDQRTYAALVGEALFLRHGPIIGRGATLLRGPFDHPIGEGYSERPVGTFTFGTHIAEVEVDQQTGRTKVINYTACHDVGKLINPPGYEGQVQGGLVQGIGYGLFEEIIVKDGHIQNPSFVDYRIPTALDIPPIKTLVVEKYEELGPFGAKGFAEQPMIAPMPALANAIFDATGLRMTTLPITPERLYHSLVRISDKSKKQNNEV